MRRLLIAVVMVVATLSPAWAKHLPMELAEKIKASGLIVTGVVTATRELGDAPLPGDMIETAHRVATVKVEEVIHGQVEGDTVEVGFLYDYACARIRLEVGQRFLFFLQRSKRGYWAPVNWQYGTLQVVEGQVDDVAAQWPEKTVPLADAIATIREALPKTPQCPACGDAGKVVPIIYGRPGPDLLEAAKRGEVVLGGCVVSKGSPSWRCRACGKEW